MATPTSALVRRSTDTQLMPPPPKRIKRPRNVLEEDEYASGLSEIIARDFFPGLLQSETQQEYLDALDSGNEAWISSVSRRLHNVMTPMRNIERSATTSITQQASQSGSETPRGGPVEDTPRSTISMASNVSKSGSLLRANTNMSLSAFQAKYTSEDNESFYQLLDKQNHTRAEKYTWLWNGNRLPSKQMLRQSEIRQKLLDSRGSISDDGGKVDRMAITSSHDKPAMPESWRHKPDNTLMFGPEGVEDHMQTVAQTLQAESRAAEKAVMHNNTRLPLVASQVLVPASPSLSAIQDAIAGRPRGFSESGFAGSETPRVNGYAFVDDEPGEVLSSPSIRLEMPAADAMPNPFVIRQESGRENLHHRLVAKASESKRTSARQGLTGKIEKTPVAPKFPSSPRVDIGNMTPAAQRLWSRVGRKGPGVMQTPGTGKPSTSGLRSAWTSK